MQSPLLKPGRRAFKGNCRLLIALQESVLTRAELISLLRQAGYRAWEVVGRGRQTLCISIRCRDRRDATRLAARLDRVPGLAVSSAEGATGR